MATLYGVDVSTHNGTIDWQLLDTNTGGLDFAILRAGYGRNNIDAQFANNLQGCIDNNIPIGIYWFSYALSVTDAQDEATYAIATISSAYPNLEYGIWYDWEYDSDDYAASQGVTMTNALRAAFAEAFCDVCIQQGYATGIYSNIDYLRNKGFQQVVNDGYSLWLAQWGVQAPAYECSIWQDSDSLYVAGFSTPFDSDIMDSSGPIPPAPPTRKKMPLWMMIGRHPYLR